jgi:8-oxo-dGTP diphosphatase
VQEETRLAINIVGLVDVAEIVRDAAAGTADKHYVLVDFCARALPGDVVAGSDAAEARWFSLAEIDELPLWSETRRIIAASTKLLEQGLQKALY